MSLTQPHNGQIETPECGSQENYSAPKKKRNNTNLMRAREQIAFTESVICGSVRTLRRQVTTVTHCPDAEVSLL